jgi:hypothetical protein
MEEKDTNWKKCDTQVFWGEVAPCDHVLQVYRTDEMFLNTLEEFVSSGIKSGDCIIIIGTINHVSALEKRLQKDFDIEALTYDNQLILLNTETTLGSFMRNGEPDESLFNTFLTNLMAKAKVNDRKIRAFGEMVAVLWAQGNTNATLQLENLWNKFCETEAFCLFCAYPHSIFTQDINISLKEICQAHTKMVGGWEGSKTELFYSNVLNTM